MGIYYAIIISGVLLFGYGIVEEAHSDELPPEVELIHSEIMSYKIETDQFKEYLRRDGYKYALPKAITYRIDCYSDGSGQLHPINGIQDIHRTLTSNGRDLLRRTILDVAYFICTEIWEARYERDDSGESNHAWYF